MEYPGHQADQTTRSDSMIPRHTVMAVQNYKTKTATPEKSGVAVLLASISGCYRCTTTLRWMAPSLARTSRR